MRRAFVCLICGGMRYTVAGVAEVAEVDVIGSADAKWAVDRVNET